MPTPPRRALAAAMLALLLAPLAPPAAASAVQPPIFSDLTYTDARRAAAQDDHLLIVRATADWCAPCKRMDQTTFIDPKVIDFFAGPNTIISLDVDTEPAHAADLRVNALPTLIAFRGDQVVGRITGYRDPAGLLTWLNSLPGATPPPQPQPPPTPTTTPKPDSTSPANPDTPNTDDPLEGLNPIDYARVKLDEIDLRTRERDHDGAAAVALELWNRAESLGPELLEIRRTTLARRMRQIAPRSKDARATFVALRDADRHLVLTTPALDPLDRWAALSAIVLNDRRDVADVLDQLAADQQGINRLRVVRRTLADAIYELGRFKLLGQIQADPVAEARFMTASLIQGIVTPADEPAYGLTVGTLQRDLPRVHAGLLAAGRTEEAWQVARLFFKAIDNTQSRRTLLATARRAGVATDWHLALANGVDLTLIDSNDFPGPIAQPRP